MGTSRKQKKKEREKAKKREASSPARPDARSNLTAPELYPAHAETQLSKLQKAVIDKFDARVVTSAVSVTSAVQSAAALMSDTGEQPVGTQGSRAQSQTETHGEHRLAASEQPEDALSLAGDTTALPAASATSGPPAAAGDGVKVPASGKAEGSMASPEAEGFSEAERGGASPRRVEHGR